MFFFSNLQNSTYIKRIGSDLLQTGFQFSLDWVKHRLELLVFAWFYSAQYFRIPVRSKLILDK